MTIVLEAARRAATKAERWRYMVVVQLAAIRGFEEWWFDFLVELVEILMRVECCGMALRFREFERP